MRKIITADQTETFVNEKINEAYHSHTGALEEARIKYTEPCKIAERAKSGTLKILDVGFGMGYNSAYAIDVALASNPRCNIEVIGLESDPTIIAKIQEVNPPLSIYNQYKKLTPQSLSIHHETVIVTIILADASESIKTLPPEWADAIFFDPFSPTNNPEMWSLTVFGHINRILNSRGIFATYTSHPLARENLASVGLLYDDGPILPRRGPGTIATKWKWPFSEQFNSPIS